MKCGYMNFLNTGKINVPSDAECVFEHIIYNAMEQIIEFYLKQPVELLKKKFEIYVEYIKKENLVFSELGERIIQRLKSENCKLS